MPAYQKEIFLSGLAERMEIILEDFQTNPHAFEEAAGMGRDMVANILRKRSIPKCDTAYKIWEYATENGVPLNLNWLLCGYGEKYEGQYNDIVVEQMEKLEQQVIDLKAELYDCYKGKKSATRSDKEKPGRIGTN